MKVSLVRRTLAAVLIAGTACAITIPHAQATPAPAETRGLFGASDPTYDGVYRQGLAILGLVAAKADVPPAATAWLLREQCKNGAFMSYRADLSAPCAKGDPVNYTGQDTNSTAMAALALQATGNLDAYRRAAAWLIGAQNKDGGWPFIDGGTSDANSTGLSLLAINAATSVNGKSAAIVSARRYFGSVQSPCTAPAATRGGIAYAPGSKVDAFATAQAALGIEGQIIPTTSMNMGAMMGCSAKDSSRLDRALSYLERAVSANNGKIPDTYTPGATNWDATATAVLALVACNSHSPAAQMASTALARNAETYITKGGTTPDRPAAIGSLLLVAAATGANPRSYGPTHINLVTRLLG